MSEQKEFRVVRDHDGDRFYKKGETRVANKSAVKHLIPRVLVELDDAKKADDASANKAEPAVANKGNDK